MKTVAILYNWKDGAVKEQKQFTGMNCLGKAEKFKTKILKTFPKKDGWECYVIPDDDVIKQITISQIFK